MALVNQNAAIMVPDTEASQKLVAIALETLQNNTLLCKLGQNANKMAYKDSALTIAKEVIKLAQENNK